MAQLIDIHSNPLTHHVRERQLHEPQTQGARIAPLYREYADHPSRHLTPSKLNAILTEAEQGNLTRQAELFTDMEEKDAHIFAEMQKRKSAILTLNYKIETVRNATPQERADAEYLTEALQELDGFESLLIDMMDAVGQGFSCIELSWKLINKEWQPAEFNYRPPAWFQLSPDDQNQLLLRTQDGKGEVLNKFGWIVHRHKSRSGYIARSGLMRTLSWSYLYRQFGIQGLAEMLEIYGIPIRIGKFPEGSTKSDRDMLLKAVSEIGRHAAGVMPKEMEIEIKDAAKGGYAPFMALTDWAEKSISKAVLGGTLTSQADGKTSTNALGTIHNEVREDLLFSDARQLAPTLRSDLLYPLLVLNRNPNADPRRTPRIRFFDANKEAGQETPAPAKAMLKNSQNSRNLDNHLRDMIDIAIKNKLRGQNDVAAMLSTLLPALTTSQNHDEAKKALIDFLKSDSNINQLHGNLADIAIVTDMLARIK